MRRLADPSAAAHVIEAAPRALHDAIREDLIALRSGTTSIERYISSASVLRRLPRATRSRPHVASLSGFRWFCRQRAVRCAVSPLRCRAAFANAIASVRPPCTPACLIDADASLSQSQPFDFCNEFSKYDTRARFCERCPRPLQGLALQSLPRTMRSSRCPTLPLLNAKKVRARCAAASYALIPRHSPSRGKPQRPESLCPRERHRSSGPAGHGIRAGRKSRAKGKRARSCDRARPVRCLRAEVPPPDSFEHLLSPTMRARRDGGPFACLYTSASSA